MAKNPVTRLPDESHAELWAHYVRFAPYHGEPCDMTGRVFGRWVVIGIGGWGASGARWLCRCACAGTSVVTGQNLRNGSSTGCKTCGATTHGMAKSRPYKIWAGMRGRCGNPDHDSFGHYGGRGIEVCERWRDDFEAFWEDMRPGYAPKLTLERRDVNGNYEPANCCWIPKAEQPQNLRRTIRIPTPRGEMTLRQASNAFGIKRDTLRARIRYGWPLSRLLEGYC